LAVYRVIEKIAIKDNIERRVLKATIIIIIGNTGEKQMLNVKIAYNLLVLYRNGTNNVMEKARIAAPANHALQRVPSENE